MSARVATVGETMALMRSRDIGSLRHISDLVLGFGGAESNVAIGLRRLGIDTKWLGRISWFTFAPRRSAAQLGRRG